MDDRELLELAAKSVGIRGRFIELFPEDGHSMYSCGIGNARGIAHLWNPLTDDGDALRLAVKLQLQITPGTYNKDEFTAFRAGFAEAHEYVHYQQDVCAATRRAIVRAAAEIGRKMKENQA